MREGEWGEDPLIKLDELRNNLGGDRSGGGGAAAAAMNIPPGAPTGFMGYPPQSFTYPEQVSKLNYIICIFLKFIIHIFFLRNKKFYYYKLIYFLENLNL